MPLEIAGVANAGDKARDLLGHVDLNERGHHYPSQLSGGEQQRVAIARALANSPPILLADEPTGNLDSKNGGLIVELIREINTTRGMTVVMVTHDVELVEQSEFVLSMRDGRAEVIRNAIPSSEI